MSSFFTAFVTAITTGITAGVDIMKAGLEGAVSVLYDSTAQTPALTNFGWLVIGISGIAIVVGLIWMVFGLVKHRR